MNEMLGEVTDPVGPPLTVLDARVGRLAQGRRRTQGQLVPAAQTAVPADADPPF